MFDGRDRSREFFQIVDRFERKLKKTPHYQRNPTVDGSSNSDDHTLESISSELKEQLSCIKDQIDELKNQRFCDIGESGIFSSMSEDILQQLKALETDFDSFSIYCQSKKSKTSQSHSHVNNMVTILRNQIAIEKERFKKIVLDQKDRMVNQDKRIQRFTQRGKKDFGIRKRQIRKRPRNRNDIYQMIHEQAEEDKYSKNKSLPQEDAYQSRHENLNVNQFAKAMVEISQMLTNMTNLVYEQGTMITRIDEDMDFTLDNIETGNANLLDYLAGIKGNRSLILKIFALLIFFILLFWYIL